MAEWQARHAAAMGETVQEGHAAHCRDYGHVEGASRCARCGDVLIPYRPLALRSAELLHWLRQQPGRCRSCGYHVVTQGHAGDCEALS